MNKETFVTNSYGIRIKKCCASCINKKFTGKRYGPVSRACVLNKDIWTGNHGLCRSWNMDSNLYNNIGKLLGDIKKAEYIAFVIGWRSAEIRYFDKRITSDIQITEDSYNESWKDRQTDSTQQQA